MVCVPHTAIRTTNLWFVGRTRLFVRRTSGLCTAHGRWFDEPVVCAPHIRSHNEPMVLYTARAVHSKKRWCAPHTICSFNEQVVCDEQVVCAPHTAVRSTNMWFRHRTRPFVSGLCTAHGRSFHEQVVYAPHTVVPS